MSKKASFLLFIILLLSTMPLPQADALGIGPPSFELDLQMDGSNSTTIYLLSDGLEGKLIIGKENLPFRVEPSQINMSKEDNYRPVELTFYGNETLEPGVYEGMVTFIAQTGGFVAVGIKIRAKINLLGKASETQHDERQELPNIDELGDRAEHMQEASEEETEPEPEFETEYETEPEPESQEMDYTPYLMGGAMMAVLVPIIILWKRR